MYSYAPFALKKVDFCIGTCIAQNATEKPSQLEDKGVTVLLLQLGKSS